MGNIIDLLNTAHSNVLACRHFVSHEILKNNADLPVEIVEVVFSKVDSIQQHLTFERVVKPGKQLDDSCFSLAVFSNQRDPFAATELKIQSIKNQA